MGIIIVDGRVIDGPSCGEMKLWKESSVLINRFINREKLVGQRLRLYQDKVRIRIPRPFPGIPVPHLHYKNKVYPLTRAQWNRFSKMIVKDLTARISKIRTVTPEELSTMSAAISISKGSR